MNVKEFVAKWSQVQQNERAIAQSHFNDVCLLAGHLPPLEKDPTGEEFRFEAGAVKPTGQRGFADVVYRGKFLWEYKSPAADLDRAYQQLLLYRDSFNNPPLLITSDIQTIIIHTNFINRPRKKYEIDFDRLLNGDGVELLRRVFENPFSFEPAETQESITNASAQTFVLVADSLKKHRDLQGEIYTSEQLAHFMVRLLFCLFAEDMNLLPSNIFSEIVKAQGRFFTNLQTPLQNLFNAMRDGSSFGYHTIRWFDGSLFDDALVPSIPDDLGRALLKAADHNWSEIDPTIFGTLFERVIDESKRAQLGAHYTGKTDIELIIDPVLMQPLWDKWAEIRLQCLRLEPEPAGQLLHQFAAEIAQTRVLDPACGSGNFLYVALQKLLDLQKEVILFAQNRQLPPLELTVSPEQLYGLEINPYAHELSQITVWIGYLQWRHVNGFKNEMDPILRPLRNITRMDAILAYDEHGQPTEPEWPPAEVIVGNPPFLGGKKIAGEFPASYLKDLRLVYKGRLPNFSDLVVYWFERGRKEIEQKRAKKACFLATNSIAMGTNLPVLKRIKTTGDIFFAWNDREWVLEGASVRIAVVGFDDGSTTIRFLNNQKVNQINANLTTGIDVTKTQKLGENKNFSFIGTQKSGPFNIPKSLALNMLSSPNKTGVSNSDVIKPWVNGLDIARRPRHKYIIDFPARMSESEASQYEQPFQYVKEHIPTVRKASHFKNFPFWIHWNTRPKMREAIQGFERYLATPRNSKHRIFVWLNKDVNPDSQVVVFAFDKDYYFGVLQSKIHEIWTLATCTWLGIGNDPRYTPTTTFNTFPFPWPPGREPQESDSPLIANIAHWARELHHWREAWLNPPNEAQGTLGNYEKLLQLRTLTNLYNGLDYMRHIRATNTPFNARDLAQATQKAVTRPEAEALYDLHTLLDRAVCEAYGWPHTINDDEILSRLILLNNQRAEENGSEELPEFDEEFEEE